MKPDDVTAMSQRDALDEWLDAPIGKQAVGDREIMRELGIMGGMAS